MIDGLEIDDLSDIENINPVYREHKNQLKSARRRRDFYERMLLTSQEALREARNEIQDLLLEESTGRG